MNFSVQLLNDRSLAQAFLGKATRLETSVPRAMLRIVLDLRRYISLNKLQGQVLRHKSGHLDRSLITDVQQSGSQVIGIVAVGREASAYGGVHERGGTFTIPEHLSRSKLGNQFTVRSHSATYPERSYMRTSLDESLHSIRDELQTAANRAIQ